MKNTNANAKDAPNKKQKPDTNTINFFKVLESNGMARYYGTRMLSNECLQSQENRDFEKTKKQ